MEFRKDFCSSAERGTCVPY